MVTKATELPLSDRPGSHGTEEDVDDGGMTRL